MLNTESIVGKKSDLLILIKILDDKHIIEYKLDTANDINIFSKNIITKITE
jgi:hypothetical protein